MAEFDVFAKNYQDLVTESTRLSGESADYFAAYKARYLQRVFAGTKVSRILDYGCGIGSLAKYLKLDFPAAQIDGFDLSEESIQQIDESLRAQGHYSSCLENFGNSYDLLVVSNVLHHVKPENRQTVLGEAFARLSGRGVLAVFEHNPYNPLTKAAVAQCPFDADAVLLKSRETRNRFRAAGFEIFRHDFIVFFPRWLAALRPLEPRLSWCAAGAQYVVLGRPKQ